MCDCIDRINEALEPQGLRLKEHIQFNISSALMTSGVMLETEKIDPSDRKAKPTAFVPSFCPFCGEKYPDREEK